MELPAVFFFLFVYVQGENAAWNLVPLVFLAMWQMPLPEPYAHLSVQNPHRAPHATSMLLV